MHDGTANHFVSNRDFGAGLRDIGRVYFRDQLCIGFSAIVAVFLLFTGSLTGAEEPGIRTTAAGGVVTVEKFMDDTKMLISVSDASRKPVFGLTSADFVVTGAGRTAKIVSVQPISESLEVPRHIVLVLDNSESMRQRNAIEPLLTGVDELLKIVRPIDRVQVVVFSKGEKVKMGGRDLRVRTFTSNQPAVLKRFVADVYRDEITLTTMLYEGMLAGLELIRGLPRDEPRFMVVFSDGEDLNSAFKERDVFEAAEGAGRFRAFGIDYMPVPEKDPFLTAFTEGRSGELWKATSETNLVPIFQSVASNMQYYYIVSYLFPTTGSLAVAPKSLAIDDVVHFNGAAPSAAPSVERRIDAAALTLSPVVDTAYGVASWKLTIINNDGALAVQAGEGSPGAELVVPFKTGDLARLAAGGEIRATMEVRDRKGQAVTLAAAPVKVNHVRTAGSLTVAPAVVTIEEIRTIDSSPMLGYVYFADGSSEIPAEYVRLAGAAETAAFDEQRFRDTLEKHY